MQKKEEPQDQALREKFAGFAPLPPDSVWKGIADRLSAREKSRRRRYWQLSAAAILLLMLLATPLWWQPEITDSEKLSKAPIPPKAADIQTNIEIEPEVIQANVTIETAAATPARVAQKTEARENLFSERVNMAYLPKIDVILSTAKRAGAMITKPAETIYPKYTGDKELLADRTEAWSNVIPKNGPALKIGMFLSPGISGKSSSYSAAYAQTLAHTVVEPLPSMGGGIDVQLQFHSRWSIGSGLHFTKISEQQGGGGNFMASAMFNGKNDYRTEASNAAPLQLSPGEMAVNSVAGSIVLNQQPSGSDFFWTNDLSGTSVAMITYSEIEQMFNVLEIPLQARYTLLNTGILVEFSGGLNANLIVGNNAYLTQPSGRTRIGETRDIGWLNFSASAGTAVVYPIGQYLSFSIEPRINYYFNSINRSSEVTYRPWIVGINTGLTYNLPSSGKK